MGKVRKIASSLSMESQNLLTTAMEKTEIRRHYKVPGLQGNLPAAAALQSRTQEAVSLN